MKRKAVVSLLSCIIALCVLSACKGRTADNMQPLGQTVDVVIDTLDTPQNVVATPDTLPTTQ